MNIHAAAKTLLTIAPNLEAYCLGLERRNLFRASHAYSSLKDPEELCRIIIDQTYRISYLRDLNRKIQTLITCFPEKHAKIIKTYYLKRKPIKVIAEKLGIEERTVFRHIHEATSYFAFRLDRLGINSFTFGRLLEQNQWINAEHQKVLESLSNFSGEKVDTNFSSK